MTDCDAEREFAVSEKYGMFLADQEIHALKEKEWIVEQLAVARKNAEAGHVMDAYQASDNVRKKYGL